MFSVGAKLYRPTGLRAFHSTSKVRSAINSIDGVIKVKEPFAIAATPIDPKYRAGYEPLYVAPSHKHIATMKRVSLAVGVVGIYVSHLMFDSVVVANELSYVVGALSTLPIPAVNYFTQNYVSRIFRLYDSTKPQTLENLVTDETLLAEKISWTGRSYYFRLAKVKDLKLSNDRFGWVNWKTDKDQFYVTDDIGGIKMDRIWGIVEHNSGVDNGRFFEK